MTETDSATEVQVEGQTNESTPSSDQAGGTPSSLEQTGFKWGDSPNVPKEWQGKTAEETAQQYNQLVSSVRNYMVQQQAAAAQPRPAAQPVPQVDPKETADLWFSDPAKAQEVFGSRLQQSLGAQVGQALGPLVQAQTMQARETVMQQDKSLWQKYGREIDAIVMSPAVSPAVRANPETWKAAMKVVKGNHVDDLVAERAAALAAAAGTGVESSSGSISHAPVGSANPLLEKMRESDYGKKLIQDYGERGMLRKLEDIEREAGISPKDYAEKVAKTRVTRNANNPGEWKTTH